MKTFRTGLIWDNDSYQKRNIGDWRRFPLFQYEMETGIIKAGVMVNLTNNENEDESIYVPAYSAMRVKRLEYPLYKQVLFMTLREVGDLLDKFDVLADAFTSSDQRQKLKKVWMELLQSHTGDDIGREQLEEMTFEEMNRKVFGLPGTSNLLKKRLGDITDGSVISDAEFYEYVQNIKSKRLELDKIYNNKNYEYGFYSYDTQYFWIPEDLLP